MELQPITIYDTHCHYRVSPSAARVSCFLYFSDFFVPTDCRCRGLLLYLITLSDTQTHTHSVGRLRTSDQPDAETYTWQHITLTRDRYPCPVWIRTRIPSERAAADPRLRPRDHWYRPRAFFSST